MVAASRSRRRAARRPSPRATSRNQLLPLARVLAARRPDIIKSWGGGANAILVRGAGVTAHARLRLRLRPERRVVHAVRRDDGVWVANLHASAHDRARGAGRHRPRRRGARSRWAGDEPIVFGGDMNTRKPVVPGFEHAGGHVIDHVFARGLTRRRAERRRSSAAGCRTTRRCSRRCG